MASRLANNRIGLVLLATGVAAWLSTGRDVIPGVLVLVGIAGWATLRRLRRSHKV